MRRGGVPVVRRPSAASPLPFAAALWRLSGGVGRPPAHACASGGRGVPPVRRAVCVRAVLRGGVPVVRRPSVASRVRASRRPGPPLRDPAGGFYSPFLFCGRGASPPSLPAGGRAPALCAGFLGAVRPPAV